MKKAWPLLHEMECSFSNQVSDSGSIEPGIFVFVFYFVIHLYIYKLSRSTKV